MKKTIALSLLAMSLASVCAEEKVVRIYNWSDYIEPALLEKFTEQTGIKVVYDTFDSNEIVFTKLLAGGTGYDVVVPSASFLFKQIEAGVFMPLDFSKIPNAKNRWELVTDRLAGYDKVNEYSINYMWGTTGIGYNIDKVKARLPDVEPNSLALIFNPENAKKLADCGIYILDAPEEVIPTALRYAGIDPNATDAASFAKAEEVLLAIRPYVKKFHSSEYINAMANGDACVTLGWSGDLQQARMRAEEANNGVHMDFAIPKEGALAWFDQMAIPKDAPHVDYAHQFINFMLEADNSAQASNFLSYASGNKAAQALIKPEIMNNPAIYPDQQTLDNLYIKQPYDSKTLRVSTRMWTKIKSGK